MEKNQRCVVSAAAPHHANRVGYFQFTGDGPANMWVVLSDKPIEAIAPASADGAIHFVVDMADLQIIVDNKGRHVIGKY